MNKKIYLGLALSLLTVACSTSPKQVRQNNKETEKVVLAASQHLQGLASWYGRPFHGRRTANGEKYNMYGYTAAHKTLPFGSKLLVVNPKNNKSLIVRVNDRGPFIGNRILDLSYAAAKDLGMIQSGTGYVTVAVYPPDHNTQETSSQTKLNLSKQSLAQNTEVKNTRSSSTELENKRSSSTELENKRSSSAELEDKRSALIEQHPSTSSL